MGEVNSEIISQLQTQLPWVNEFRQKYAGGISHTFVLHGAVDDYVCHLPLKADTFLAAMLGQTRDIVCFYDVSRGIEFAQPSMRKPFLEAAGAGDSEQVASVGERLFPDPLKALYALERAMLNPLFRGKIAVIFHQPEMVWPDTNLGHLSERDRMNLATIRRWAKASEFIAAEQVILMLTGAATDLHSTLRTTSSMVETIEISYPNLAERAAFIAESLSRRPGIQMAPNITPEMFAALTGGLSRQLIDDICLRAVIEERPVDFQLIKDRKDQIIRQEFGELIEILEPQIGFNQVGGMEEVKNYLMRRVVAPLRGQAPMNQMPSGVLLAGPPGTGKTMLVTALAREAGVNVVKLNAGRLLGQYVGNSERNLERALTCIRSLTPVIVMIDEIEQQFQRGGSEGNGVERRIFGRILEEMSGASGTKRGEVLWFAATNRVDLVDAALRRPGRFDRIVPILPPAPQERLAIIATKLPPGTQMDQQSAGQLAAATEHYTGADLDGVMIKAAEVAFDHQRQHIAIPDVLTALTLLRPGNESAQVQEMIQVALEHCNDLSLVPASWRSQLEPRR